MNRLPAGSILRASLALFLTGAILSCGSESGTAPDEDAVERITVTPTTSDVNVGSSVQYTAVAFNGRDEIVTDQVTVQWSVVPSSLATVGSDGRVTGVAPGEGEVRATAEGVSGTATVVVVDPTPPAAPTEVEARPVSHTEMEVSWSDVSDREDEYRIEREEVVEEAAGEGSAAVLTQVGTVGADVTTFFDEGLAPGSSYRYVVRACNENGCLPERGGGDEAESSTGPVTTHAELTFSTVELPTGIVDVSYQAVLEAEGGDGTFSWSVMEGALPDGLSLDGDEGTLSGTPAEPGDFEVTVEVSGGGQSVARAFDLTILEQVQPPRILTEELPGALVGAPYEAVLEADRGDGSYAWSLTGGELPDGLSLSSSGEISGTPTAPGSLAFIVEVTSGGLVGEAVALTLTVSQGSPSITTTSLPDGALDEAYAAALEAEGGDGSYTWSIVDGVLPDGLSLDEGGGTISGTPSSVGTFEFTIGVTSSGLTDEQELSIRVATPPVTVTSRYLEGGNTGEPYEDAVEASGGDGTVSWSLVAGALPAGVSLSGATGLLAGTPTTPGVFYFTIQAESAGTTDRHTYAMAVSSRPSSAFNLWVVNVTTGDQIPSAGVIDVMSDAVDRWEEVVVGDLGDVLYDPDQWGSGTCGGHGQHLNGQFIDDMVVMLNLASIDGPGGTLGSAGPCGIRVLPGPHLNTVYGRLTLDTDDLDNLALEQQFGLVWHEIGHIVGIGTLWHAMSSFSGTNLVSDRGGSDPRYEGIEGNDVFVNDLDGGSASASKIPVEADGGSGTRDGHWDEGEFDSEMMTGWAEAAGVVPRISAMTIASLLDLAYTVDLAAADPYDIPACAPTCGPVSSAVWAPGGGGKIPLDDIADDPIYGTLPDGTVVRVTPPGNPK